MTGELTLPLADLRVRSFPDREGAVGIADSTTVSLPAPMIFRRRGAALGHEAQLTVREVALPDGNTLWRSVINDGNFGMGQRWRRNSGKLVLLRTTPWA